jgi:hypothetical protein
MQNTVRREVFARRRRSNDRSWRKIEFYERAVRVVAVEVNGQRIEIGHAREPHPVAVECSRVSRIAKGGYLDPAVTGNLREPPH